MIEDIKLQGQMPIMANAIFKSLIPLKVLETPKDKSGEDASSHVMATMSRVVLFLKHICSI